MDYELIVPQVLEWLPKMRGEEVYVQDRAIPDVQPGVNHASGSLTCIAA